MARIDDQAVCLRHLDWSETSQVVALLTRDHGLVRGIAKGAKRLSPAAVARFSGGIELLTVGHVIANTKPSADLAGITEWNLEDALPHLRRDLASLELAYFLADATAHMLAELDPHPRSFDALVAALRAMADPRGRDAAALVWLWTLLLDVGYRPQLFHDCLTGQVLDETESNRAQAASTWVFDAREGGLTLQRQASPSQERWQVRRRTVDLLRDLSQRGGDDAAAGDAGALIAHVGGGDLATVQRAARLLCVYLRSILGRELPTMRVLLSG